MENLKEKLRTFLQQEHSLLTEKAQTLVHPSASVSSPKAEWETVSELSRQLEGYAEKYNNLVSEYKSVISITNSNLMDSQNKWFQIVKELVQSCRFIIQLVTKHNKELTSERRFINVRKKIDRFERFVSKRLEDLISQSQDLSVFDRPSINEISETFAATQKSYSNNLPDLNPLILEEYTPLNFKTMIESLSKGAVGGTKEKNLNILKGLIFRILKSKDAFVRRQNIVGILEADLLGARSGLIKNHCYGALK